MGSQRDITEVSTETLVTGHGTCRPADFSTCQICLVAPEGDALDVTCPELVSSAAAGSSEVVIGLADNCISHIIEECLLNMVEGEKCKVTLTFKSSRCCGTSNQRSTTEQGDQQDTLHSELNDMVQCCTFHLTLGAIVKHGEWVHKLNSEEKLQRASVLKTAGVTFYKDKKLDKAFSRFGRALKYLLLISQDEVSGDVAAEYEQLKCQCYLNLAACQLTMDNTKSVIENCTHALALAPRNVKGLYRRAQALVKAGDLAGACRDLTAAIEIDPDNKAIQRLLKWAMDKEKGI